MKKAGLILGILLALIITAVVGLEFYFTSDRLKSMAEPPIEEALQRDVEIGKMELSFLQTFPNAGVTISDFLIPGLQQDTAASFRQVVVGIDLIPLLSSQINITELNIDKPFVNYRINKDGTTNFDLAPVDTTEEVPDTEAADTTDSQMNLQIPEVVLKNARIIYNDETTGMHAAINDLSGQIGLNYADLIETNLQLDAGGISVASDTVTYLEGLPLSINEVSVIDLPGETITLKEGGIAVKGLQIDLSGSISEWSSDAPALDLNFATSSDQFGELLKLIPEAYQEQISEFDAGGSLSFSGSVKGKVAEDELPRLDARLDVQNAFLQHPDLQERISDIAIQAGITNEEISLNRFEASAGENTMNANGAILKPLGDNPIAKLTADASMDLSTIPNYYPIDTDTLEVRGQLQASVTIDGSLDEPEKALKNASFSLENGYLAYYELGKPIESLVASGRVEGNQLRLDKLDMKSGNNSVNVSGVVNRFQSENPNVDLAISSNFDLSEVPDYYSLEPYLNEISGTILTNLNVNGSTASPENMDVAGSIILENANFSGDSLPTAPITGMNANIEMTGANINIKSSGLKIGPTDINFNGSIKRYRELAAESIEQPVEIDGQLTSKLFNYDAMFPEEPEETDEELEPVPMEIPNIDVQINIEADSILYMGTGFYDARADLSIVQDKIKITNMDTGIMSGRARGTLVWNIPNPLSTNMSFTGRVENIESSRFFREFQVLGEDSSFDQYLSGEFNASVDYASNMDEFLEPVLESSVAEGDFGMTESMLEDHPAQISLSRFLNEEELKRLKLDQWQADYILEDGILELKNMNLRSGNLEMALEGKQDLIEDELDYTATLWVPQKYAGNLSKVISSRGVKALTQDDGRVKIPMSITGSSENVRYRPDKEIINDLIKELLKDNVKDKIGNIFGDG